ncbi:quinol oxidase [Burkholderia guangdongensis]|uniref:quinol oxidase n=1 Tax=Burkholderia guangdongensis TaxID=1792500 RepID=UPI0015C87E83|nr:quinol oxidase [Burkholderia guangdongensis]
MSTMSMTTRILTAACAAAASLALAASVPLPAHADEAVYRAAVDADGVQRVAIVGGSYFFRPKHVIVKANVPVELTVTQEPGMIPHSFEINAPQAGIAVHTELSTTPRTLRFTPTEPGRFAYYCTHRLLFFKSHRERGMEGVLEVEASP